MDEQYKQEKRKLPTVDFTSGSETESDLNHTSDEDSAKSHDDGITTKTQETSKSR